MADCTPRALAAAASCLRCLPKRRPVRTYLLCQWANLPTFECTDADALAFIARAGITDQTQKDAVCQLVLDLKNTGTPSFWSRDIIIYPMIGQVFPDPNGYSSHRVNLKTALSSPGLYDFVQYAGVTPKYVAGGVEGNGTNAFVNTMFIPSVGGAAMRDEIRIMYYLDSESTIDVRWYFGTANAGRLFSRREAGTPPFSFSANDTTTSGPFSAAALGAIFIQRSTTIDAGKPKMAAYQANPWTKLAVASTGLSNRYLVLLAYCNAAPDPPANPVPFATSYTDARLSGFSLGSPLTDAERLQYKAIWDTFETAVGRGHP